MRPIRLKGNAMTALRVFVFERDGMRCVRCGEPVSDNVHPCHPQKAHLAHKISRGRGGGDTPENTECACNECHMVKEHNPKSVPKK